jgi:hypothetical protein
MPPVRAGSSFADIAKANQNPLTRKPVQSVSDTWSLAKIVRKVEFKLVQ